MAHVASAPVDLNAKAAANRIEAEAALAAARRQDGGEAFRLAMREFASSVSVVTTGREGYRTGCTATSLCSLSLDPPSLIVCIALTSSTLASLRDNRTFGVNILAGGDGGLADRFAGRSGLKGAARFAGAEWMTLVDRRAAAARRAGQFRLQRR